MRPTVDQLKDEYYHIYWDPEGEFCENYTLEYGKFSKRRIYEPYLYDFDRNSTPKLSTTKSIDYSQGDNYHSYIATNLYFKERKVSNNHTRSNRTFNKCGFVSNAENKYLHRFCLESYLKKSTISLLQKEYSNYLSSKQLEQPSKIKKIFRNPKRMLQNYRYDIPEENPNQTFDFLDFIMDNTDKLPSFNDEDDAEAYNNCSRKRSYSNTFDDYEETRPRCKRAKESHIDPCNTKHHIMTKQYVIVDGLESNMLYEYLSLFVATGTKNLVKIMRSLRSSNFYSSNLQMLLNLFRPSLDLLWNYTINTKFENKKGQNVVMMLVRFLDSEIPTIVNSFMDNRQSYLDYNVFFDEIAKDVLNSASLLHTVYLGCLSFVLGLQTIESFRYLLKQLFFVTFSKFESETMKYPFQDYHFSH